MSPTTGVLTRVAEMPLKSDRLKSLSLKWGTRRISLHQTRPTQATLPRAVGGSAVHALPDDFRRRSAGSEHEHSSSPSTLTYQAKARPPGKDSRKMAAWSQITIRHPYLEALRPKRSTRTTPSWTRYRSYNVAAGADANDRASNSRPHTKRSV